MNKNTAILLGVVAVAVVGGYIIYKKQKDAAPVTKPVAVSNPDQRNPGTPVNAVGEYLNKGQEVLDAFRKAFGGF